MASRLSTPKWDLPIALGILGLALLFITTFVSNTPTQAASTTIVISEFRTRGSSGAADEFIEIYNLSASSVDISGWKINASNSGGTVGTRVTIAANTTLGPGCRFLATNTGYSGSAGNQTYGTGIGDDGGIGLLNSSNTIIDQVGMSNGSAYKEGTVLATTPSNVNQSYERKPLGTNTQDTDNNSNDFSLNTSSSNPQSGCGSSATATPVPPTATPVPPVCGDPYTDIYDIQGSGTASTFDGTTVSTEGVVTAEFQGTNELDGFYIQDPTGDNNDLTSDGIFVYSTSAVTVGDSVRVVGTVDEYFDLTELTSVTGLSNCGTGSTVQPITVTLPVTSTTVLERYEGMLVTFTQTLHVSGNFTLGRYGEVELASERLWTPTHLADPGAAANAVAAENALKYITLDDYSTVQNPDPVIYPSPYLSATNTLRTGDTVTNLTGVVHYAFSLYRLQPTITPSFVATNPRTTSPDPVGGTLRVASFNVLNYFTTIDQTGAQCYPDMNRSQCRGADSATEFTRQQDKIVSAMLALDPDIVGLMEMENNGYDASSAIQNLVDELNSAAPVGTTYDFIDPGTTRLGGDAIAVGFIYRVETAEPVGAAVTTSSGAFSANNRQPLVQTFRQISTDGLLTVAVNHFKSKGSDCDDNGDPDTGDGQGNCNLTRVAAAEDLVEWLATDPTGSGDADFLIIGDLNSYAREDPITTIKDAGYTNLLYQYLGDEAYSYVFDAASGYLDHALATSSLTDQVTGATEWHINADEPISLDYNMENKTTNQDTIYYNDDPYRSSDHDPVLVGMTLEDDSSSVSFSSSTYSVDEDAGSVTITATLRAASAVTITVPYTTSNGTAEAGIDYISSSGTLTFTPGITSTTFNVAITDDAVDENNETVNLTLGTPVSTTLGNPSSATLTILDNESASLAFDNNSYSVGEEAGSRTVTVTLSTLSALTVTVNYATSNGSATAGSDYTSSSGTITFTPGLTSTTFSVPITSDVVDEDDETVSLTLSGASQASLGSPSSATLTIQDNDSASVQLSSSSYSVGEEAGSAAVTATLSTPSAFTVTVNYASSDGSASAGSDYTSSSGTITFTPGITSTTFSVPITSDVVDEDDETVSLTLSGASQASLGSPSSATLTILDNDSASVQFSSSSYSVGEEAGSATVTVTLSTLSVFTVTVNYASSNGSASAGSDYTSSSGTITFTPGITIATFSVPITSDVVDEDDETVSLTLSGASQASLGSPSSATLTILDNESASLAFDNSSYSVGEEAGSRTVTVTLSTLSALTVTVNYASSDGSASAGSDYTSSSGTITFTPGITSTTFSVPITSDVVDEDDETVSLTLSGASQASLGSPSSATLTILDNDSASVQLSSNSYSVGEEAGSATVTVELSTPSAFTVTVNYASSDGSATAGSDYTSSSGTITFTPGITSTTFSVPITSDVVDEDDETVSLTLSGASQASLGSPSSATLTILDNDSASVQFSSSSYSVGEEAGSATVTVELSIPSAFTVTVNYASSNGSATAGSDYTSSSGTITFTPGLTSTTFSVPITSDVVDEDDETVSLTLSGASQASLGSPSSATLTILDNESASLAFDNSSYSVGEEAGSRTVTVTLSTPSALTVTVSYASSDGSASAGSDYTSSSGTITFTPGITTATFNVPILDDALIEGNETVSLTLSSVSGASLGTPSSATLTILDDESATVQFSSSSYSVGEGAGSATITVILSAPLASTATVDYASSDGSATAGSDYTSSSGTITFTPGLTTTTFSVPIANDSWDESNEALTLTLSGANGATLDSLLDTATLTILDNDSATVQFSSATYSVSESGGSATITATLSTLSTFTVTVNYASSNGTATAGSDYTSSSGTLTFAPGETSRTFTVPIINDGLFEGNETVSLALSAPQNATLGTPSSAVLTITDNDVASPTPVTPSATPVTPSATPVTPSATPITPSATPVTPSATAVPPTATRTATSVPPTATRTATSVPPTVTRTATSVPPTATRTATSVPPTATRTATSVPPTATRTATSVPPTSTKTATPTATRTATSIPPTATRTPTRVPPTATRTPTRVPPTATRTPTRVPPTATRTPTKTSVPTMVLSPTPSRTPTVTVTRTPTIRRIFLPITRR